jgi:hypothetical protein
MASYRADAWAGNAGTRGSALVLSVALALGCGEPSDRPAAPVAAGPADGAPAAPDTGVVALAPDAAGWRIRSLAHVPNYFELSGWKDERTLFGRAGCNPVEVRIDEPEFTSWDVSACGGATLAPDRDRAAWGDGMGAILVGGRGGPARVVRDAGARSPSGEGDPTSLALWSPDGRRLLVSWAGEAGSTFAVADVTTGAVEPVVTRIDGYFAAAPWGWLDAERILFTTEAVRNRQGESEYRESGGYRGDLAVLDLGERSFRAVTAVPDGSYLRPLARWSGREMLVGEALGAAIERYWIYDAETWARRPLALPPGRAVFVADSARAALLGVEADGAAPLTLREGSGVSRLATLRLQLPALAWSPDGSRLAITGAFDDPLPDQPGSFVTRYAAYLIEPR